MTLAESKAPIKNLKNFLRQKESLLGLFVLSQLWITFLPYSFPYILLAYLGNECGVVSEPFDAAIWIVYGVAHLFNITYFLYLFLKKEISLTIFILFPLIVSILSLVPMFFLILPMC